MMPTIAMAVSGPEEIGYGHVTGYMIMELYGFSMELPVQNSLAQL